MNESMSLVKSYDHIIPIVEQRRQTSRDASLTITIWRKKGYALFFVDILTIVSSFMFSYFLRFHLQFLAIKKVPIGDIAAYFNGALLLGFIWTLLIWRQSGYDNGLRGLSAPMVRLRTLLMTGVYALGLMMILAYLFRGLMLSRQVYLMTGFIAGSILVSLRLLIHTIDRNLAENGIVTHRLIIAGTGKQAREFVHRLKCIGGGIRTAGFVRWRADQEHQNEKILGYPVLGDLSELKSIYAQKSFDKLILTASAWSFLQTNHQKEKIIEVLNFCEAENISLYTLPESFNIAVTKQEIGCLSGLPLIRLKDASLHPAYACFKRCLDVSIAILGILFGMPFWLMIGLVIKLTSRGPVLFTQTRIGIHGKPFKIYKFRTMVDNAEDHLKDLIDIKKLKVPGFKITLDPRVTFIGRLLRRFSLDEFPQLINVLRGEMSLVGPRPELPELVGMYTPEQRRRLKAKPGMTGYQQVLARGKPLAACCKYDLIYLKYQSFLFDLFILFRTIFVVIRGNGIT